MEATLICPWCKRVSLPIHRLKIHVKFCNASPRPRGVIERRRRNDWRFEYIGFSVEPAITFSGRVW